MVRFYLVYGVLLCIVFVYAGAIGWKVVDPFAVAVARPIGPGGHYHK
jgi:hypothetical protein